MLGEVAEQIDSVFHIGATFIINLLHFNYLFVSALAGSFHTITSYLCSALCSFLCACGYALNDLIVFLSEIIGGIVMLVTFIGETIEYIKITVQCFVYYVVVWITAVVNALWRNALVLLHLVNFTIATLFSGLIFLLQILPLLFVQIVMGLGSGINYVTTQIRNVLFYVTEIPKRVLDVFLEIPPGAYIGCMMLLVSCITIKVVRYFLRTFAFNLQELLFINKLKFFLLYGYILLKHQVNRVIYMLALHRDGDNGLQNEDDDEDSLSSDQNEYEDSDTNDETEITGIVYRRRPTRIAQIRPQCDSSGEEDCVEEYGQYKVTSLKTILQKERERLLCVVCQDNLKTMMLLPCRHLCMCQNCVSIIMEDRNICPICRRPIHEVMRVYL